MSNSAEPATGRLLGRALLFGLSSLVLYSLLYAFESELIAFSGKGGWYFILPVVIAFVFSYAHGAFTGHFWDLLGIKAKK